MTKPYGEYILTYQASNLHALGLRVEYIYQFYSLSNAYGTRCVFSKPFCKKYRKIEITQESITGENGPSSFTIIDPDGNPILIDQHV